MNAYSPNLAIRQIHDQYNRKFRKRGESKSLEEEIYFNASNIWRSSSMEEEKLHQAIRKSELFSQNRIRTFVRFNYRSMEARPLCYKAVHQKLLSGERQGDKINYKGTMHVSELWCEKNLQDVLGSIAYPKDRLKILNQYQNQKKIRIRKQNFRGFRDGKENIFN